VFWTLEADLATVLLASSPLTAGAPVGALAAVDDDRSRSDALGRRVVLGDGVSAIHLALLGLAGLDQPLAAVIPLDADLPVRLAAAARLWRGLQAGASAAGDPLTTQRRRRLKQMLRAVDGRASGAAHREIAQALFGEARVAAEVWKTSALRDATMRLVRDGLAMVRGRYRTLLRPHRLSR